MINYQKVWATLDIDEKMAFRDRTIKAMQEIYPHYIVRPWEPTEADFFFVGNKQENVRVRVPLKDLYAWYSTSAKTAATDTRNFFIVIPIDHSARRVLTDVRLVPAAVMRQFASVVTGQQSEKSYVSLSLAAPEFGPRKLYANLGRAAGQDDDSVYAIIWNPAD